MAHPSSAANPAPTKHRLHNPVIAAAFVAALGVFLVLWMLPNALGFAGYVDGKHRNAEPIPCNGLPALGFGLLYLFLQIVFPFLVSNWFFRLMLRFAGRWLYGASATAPNRSQCS